MRTVLHVRSARTDDAARVADLAARGVTVRTAPTAAEAARAVDGSTTGSDLDAGESAGASAPVECVVVERNLGGDGSGHDGREGPDGDGDLHSVDGGHDSDAALDAIGAVRERRPDVPVVCCSDEPDGEFAAAATRRGASEYHARATADESLADRVAALLSGASAADGGVTPDAGTAGDSPVPVDAADQRRFAALLETWRALLGARSRDGVARAVVDATTETLGSEHALVRLYDCDSGLVPVAVSGDGALGVDEQRSFAAGEGGPGTAYATGELQRSVASESSAGGGTDATDAASEADGADAGRDSAVGIRTDAVDGPGTVSAAIHVPLGEYGALSVGTSDDFAFDEVESSMVETLAANAVVALERIEREDELRQYRTVLENVQDMVYVVDEDERFSLVTDPLADWLGYDRADLEGSPPASVLAEDAIADFESVIADLWHGDGTDTRTLETAFRTATGETRPATVDVSVLPAESEYAGTVGVVRDRSELREARERLAAQRDRFSYLFDNLPDAVVEGGLGEDGEPVVTAVNDAFTEVFGYDEETVRGESLNEFVLPPDGHEEGAELDRRTAAGEVVQRAVRRRTADGYRDFLFRGVPYDTRGDSINGFGIYTDITEQKERERRLEIFNRVLRHNLRNDLNVVLGYAQMLSRRIHDPELADWAETLREKAAEVTTLSERARSLDRTMSRGSSRDSTVRAVPVIESVVADFRADNPAATVETDLADLTVVGDSRLSLALSELLDNCVEHCGDDVVVRVTLALEDGRAALRVVDDGPGIPASERAIVDGSAEITQLNHGSGLGLWIVKWVCVSCGGRLGFESGAHGASAVVVSLTPADEQESRVDR